jgi:hypothetical protein
LEKVRKTSRRGNSSSQRERGVALLGVDEVAQRLVEQHDDALGQRLEQRAQLVDAHELAGGSLGLHSATSRVRSLTARSTPRARSRSPGPHAPARGAPWRDRGRTTAMA